MVGINLGRKTAFDDDDVAGRDIFKVAEGPRGPNPV